MRSLFIRPTFEILALLVFATPMQVKAGGDPQCIQSRENLQGLHRLYDEATKQHEELLASCLKGSPPNNSKKICQSDAKYLDLLNQAFELLLQGADADTAFLSPEHAALCDIRVIEGQLTCGKCEE